MEAVGKCVYNSQLYARGELGKAESSSAPLSSLFGGTSSTGLGWHAGLLREWLNVLQRTVLGKSHAEELVGEIGSCLNCFIF